MEEIKYEELTKPQKQIADLTLAAYKICFYWGRQSGRTYLAKYLLQEFKKLAKPGHEHSTEHDLFSS